ncbi:rhomboid family intramembrane serine protease [Teredinibacter haidensis]|uniref:rhomboid family intramembrane serine protease n=1 Tax=Teredinibacter haidensis TaxID=2731755 RepID=UPI000948DDB6|nr:rhomboid family intramembrane serine protease [Teredinibacter haidensis]
MQVRIKVILWLVIVLVGVHLANSVVDGKLLQFGILPGNTSTLPYIFTAPFLHGSWAHLANNLIGLIVFSALCLLRGIRFYVLSSLFIITVTGSLVWILGRHAMHIGASGWVFGLWSLSIATAWFDRKFYNIAIALFVLFFWGSMILGVLPNDPRISFESHLFGAVSGIVCAYFLVRRRGRK